MRSSLVAQMERFLLRCKRPGFDPWPGKIPWKRTLQPTPVFLPENPHGQRSPVGYSAVGHKESDTTEGLSTQKVTSSAKECMLRASQMAQW